MSTRKSILILSLIILIGSICNVTEAKAVTEKESKGNKIVLEYEFSKPVISSRAGYDLVQMEGLKAYERTGAPMVPVSPVKVLVPFGKKVVASKVTVLDERQMPGTYRLAPAQKPYPLSYKGPIERTKPNPAIYGQAKPWPGIDHEQVGTQSKRGYQVFTVNLFPLQYIPTTGEVYYATKLQLEIDLADSVTPNVLRPTEKVKSVLNRMVDNPSVLGTYPAKGDSVQKLGAAATLLSGGPYQYVIITNQALENAPGPWNFQALRDAKIAKGITATIVTTEWIYANYDGTRPDGGSDNQTRIRNFLIDAYQTWGTEYVLLGGTNAIVPARMFYVDGETMPVDMYYGCVDPPDCNFDYNRNGYYGEPTDGVGGGDVDLYAEIYVGRAPVENTTELANFVKKTLTYDSTYNEYLHRIAMLGEWLGFGGVADYATDMMEQIRLGGNHDGYFTYGFENHIQPNFITFDTNGCLSGEPNACWPLYDAPPCYPPYCFNNCWTRDELINLMNGGIHIFNHMGHGTSQCMAYYKDFCVDYITSELNNTDYFFVYSQACVAGAFDTTGCFAEVITSMEHGAFAVIMNARSGWGRSDSTDGPSQRFNRQFWDAVLGEGIFEIGRANQDSKEDNLGDINGDYIRYCYYELNLFGDPEQQFRFGVGLTKVDHVNAGDCVWPGQEINYTIDYNYPAGPNLPVLSDVNIVDNLPAEVEPNNPLDPNYNPSNRTYIWNIGTLHPGDAGFVTLKVDVNFAQPGGTIENKCEIRSGGVIYSTAYEYTPVCCSTLPTGSYLDEVMADDPCLYITFDEDPPVDHSGHNYWVSSTAVIEKTSGSMGKAAHFYSGSLVAAANRQTEPPLPVDYNDKYAFAPGDISFELWFKADPGIDSDATFFNQADNS
jgi:hypothetical protein